MKVRLKTDYKTKGHIHYLKKGTLVELYDSFEFLNRTFFNTNKGFRISCVSFDDLFVKVGD